MAKRNVCYIKPEEPKFLKKIKAQAGYVEAPTINTKRQDLGDVETEDLDNTIDEQPTIVVLEPGDLTAEEVADINNHKKEDNSPADLTKPIVFRAKLKNRQENIQTKEGKDKQAKVAKHKSKKVQPSLLSFDRDKEDEDY